MNFKSSNIKPIHILSAVVAGLIVVGFWIFANPSNQKMSVTAPVESGLVGYWNMDSSDIYENTLYDKSGYGNHGTIYGATTTTGKIKQALSFDGSDDYVSIPTANFASFDELSISFWLRFFSIPSEFTRVIHKGDTSGSSHGFIIVFRENGQIIGAYQTNYTSNQIERRSSINLSVNEWHHIAMAYNGSDIDMYINGQLRNGWTGTSEWFADDGNNFSIGSRAGGTAGFFNGLIDEVRIYNRALTAEEVSRNYNASGRAVIDTSLKGRWTDGLVGYWSFDGPDIQGLNATATDVSGNGNHGTIYGAQPTIGKIGQALSFDGADDYLNMGNSSIYNFTSQNFTYSGWSYIENINDIAGLDVMFIRGAAISDGYYFSFRKGGGVNELGFYLATNQSEVLQRVDSSFHLVPIGSWFHWAVVRDGTVGRIFINGSEATYSRQDSLVDPASSNRDLIVAHWPGLGRHPRMKLDEFRIYNRALSAEEILEHYQGGMRRMEIQKPE